MADATAQLARRRLRLSEMELTVVQRACIKHQAADALSRMETTRNKTYLLDDDLPVMTIVAPLDESDKENNHYPIDEDHPTRHRGADLFEAIDTMESTHEGTSIGTDMIGIPSGAERRQFMSAEFVDGRSTRIHVRRRPRRILRTTLGDR